MAADGTAEYFADLKAGNFVYGEVDLEAELLDSFSGTFTIGEVTFQRDEAGNLTEQGEPASSITARTGCRAGIASCVWQSTSALLRAATGRRGAGAPFQGRKLRSA